MRFMRKTEGIEVLGGSARSAAEAVGVSPQAVCDWPELLPPRIADRVIAAWVRKNLIDELPQVLRGSQGVAHD